MNLLTKMLVAVVTTIGISTGAMAQDRATPGEAKALADLAAAHVTKVGPERAFSDFSAGGQWKSKDLYVIAYDMKGNCVASGANAQLIGKNQLELKDPNGMLIIKEMITASTPGHGSIDYRWTNPVTKNIEAKTTYVVKLANYDGFVGAGAYK
jgi:cytochrome c